MPSFQINVLEVIVPAAIWELICVAVKGPFFSPPIPAYHDALSDATAGDVCDCDGRAGGASVEGDWVCAIQGAASRLAVKNKIRFMILSSFNCSSLEIGFRR